MPEDFESLLEQSFEDPEIMEILHEKKNATEGKPATVSEIVKGYPGPQREIDLHGKTSSEAMFELKNFIKSSVQHRLRTVRVITGKGLHSKHMKSVLPEVTERVLSEFRDERKVFTFRKEKTGGSYVVYLVS